MRNYFLWLALILLTSISVGMVMAAPLTDQVTPRNITFTESGTGIKNASRIAFSDGTSATSWSTYVTTTVLSTYQALVYGNFTALFTSDSSINATAVSALTGVGTINSSYQSADSALTTRINTVNTTTQNLLTSNTSLYALVLQLGQNDTSINASITTLSTFAQTKASNATIVCANGTFIQNITLTNSSVTWGCAVDFGSGGSAYDDTGIRTNISNLQTSNASVYALILQLGQNDTNLNASINAVNTRVTTLNTTIQNLLTSNTSIYSLILQLGQNDTNLNTSINAVNTRVTTLNTSIDNLYVNVTNLQSSNTSTNTRINTINTTVQNLLSSNTSINTRVDTVNTTVQNLLSSNTSINTRVDTINTTVQNLLSSNTSVNTRIDTLNTTKGVANLSFTTISTTSGTSPVADAALDTLTLTAGSGITITGDSSTDTVTIAATGSGTGNVSGSGLAGNFALWNGTATINQSAIYQNGTIVVIGSPNSDTGAGSQQQLEISANGPRAQIDINDNGGVNGTRLHLRSGTLDFYIGMNSTSPLFFENESGTWVMNLSHSGVLDVARNITVAGYAVLTNNSSIDFGQITGYSTALINTTMVNATNTETTGYCLTSAGSGDQFTWATCGTSTGSGNLTATTNGTLGYYAVFTNTTNVKNGSLYEDTSGNLASKRNINIKSDDNTNRAYQINGTDVLSWIQSSNRIRIGLVGRLAEWSGTGAYISDGGDFDISVYDTANNTVSISNGDTGEAWVVAGDKLGVNHTVTANSKALTVVGEANVSKTLYLGQYTTCQTLGTSSTGQVLCQTNGSSSGYDDTGLRTNVSNLQTSNTSLYALILQLGQNDTNLNASINAVNTRVTTTNNSLQLALVNITDLQNSNASVKTRIDTINTTVQNLLSSNTSINTRVDTVNATTVSLSTNLTTLSNTVITTFGVRLAGSNATMSNSSTFDIYCGSGVSCNASTTAPRPGITLTASAGGGNVSGGSVNGTLGFLAIWNSTTTVTNSSLYTATNGDFYAKRDIIMEGITGADRCVVLNITTGAGFCYIGSSNRIRFKGGGNLFEFVDINNRIYFDGDGSPNMDLYSDNNDRTYNIINEGSKGANLFVDNNITINDGGLIIKSYNTTYVGNTSDNTSIKLNAVNAGIDRLLINRGERNANVFMQGDLTLTPTYALFPGAGSSTTVPIQMGVAAGTAASAVGTVANVNLAWGGAMWGCSTGTGYLASCASRKATLDNYRLAGFYMTGNYFMVTAPGTDSTGTNHFAGMRSAMTNASSITWAANYSTVGSYVGFMVNTNTTNGLGVSWHFISSDATTSRTVNTTINATLGHNYLYGIYCPPSSASTECYGWMRDTNATSTEGTGEFTGTLSANLPAASTALAPGISYTNKQATTRTVYMSGYQVATFPWRY